MCQEAEKTKVATQEFDMARSKIFNVHSIILGMISKLKTKSQQRKNVNIK